MDALQLCSRPLLYKQAARESGIALARIGRTSDALDKLNAAFDGFVQCEAISSAQSVARELRPLGTERRTPTHRRDKTGSASLAEAELKVVTLIAEGSTNRNVAERPNLSPNTVKTHVRDAFAKLG